MKKKLLLTASFAVSLLPALFPQYGGHRGVQEISGLIHLRHPIGMISVLLFLIGVWFPFKYKNIREIVELSGLIGVVVSEIYQFLTWYLPTITGECSIVRSFEWTFPEWYIGLLVSLLMIAAFLMMDKKKNEKKEGKTKCIN